jgi:hypothetical protein
VLWEGTYRLLYLRRTNSHYSQAIKQLLNKFTVRGENGELMKKEKVESILNTAKKMFARYGLRKTSMDEMAGMARVAKATIYTYFGNKDQVYLEVLRREANEIVEKVSFDICARPSIFLTWIEKE